MPEIESEAPPARDATLLTAASTILVVDDEKNIRRTLGMVLSGVGYRILEAGSAEQAMECLNNPLHPIDLAIVDLKLPGQSGLDLLESMKRDDATSDIPVVVISGHASVQDAVQAIKLGASDFFEKPLNRDRIVVSVENSIRGARLRRTVEQMRLELEQRYQMVGTSEPLQKLFRDIDRVAPTKANVLITGESGTGKELVSRALHRLSPRRDAPFVKVNCAAMPRELIESELFGHERGAFTGAHGAKRGLFEQAHGGTLFLDEIGDMDLTAQAKVLRVLQNGELSRVGSEHVMHVDVRLLAATNKDLGREVAAGRFREDLFFRLEVFPLHVPALRERPSDIPLLAEAFVASFCQENGLRTKRIDPAFFQALQQRSWPGNVRELKNVVERAAILSSDVISIADLPEDPHLSPFDDDPRPAAATATAALPSQQGERLSLREYRDAAERAYILQTLVDTDWNISRAAVSLSVERTNLHKKIRAYGIKRGEE
jgi:two-component system, NtrC family, nitrogen regulation response regulator NtrX